MEESEGLKIRQTLYRTKQVYDDGQEVWNESMVRTYFGRNWTVRFPQNKKKFREILKTNIFVTPISSSKYILSKPEL